MCVHVLLHSIDPSTVCVHVFIVFGAVECSRKDMVEMTSKVSVKKFVPKSGVVIHTNDEEAKAAESSGGERERDEVV